MSKKGPWIRHFVIENLGQKKEHFFSYAEDKTHFFNKARPILYEVLVAAMIVAGGRDATTCYLARSDRQTDRHFARRAKIRSVSLFIPNDGTYVRVDSLLKLVICKIHIST